MSGIAKSPGSPADSLLLGLPDQLARVLMARARPVPLKAGRTLFAAGDETDGCYFIEEGLLKVTVSLPGKGDRILSILAPGSVVGELSLIDGSPRSATVTALRDSKLNFVRRHTFQAFAEDNPEVARCLTQLLARRLRETNVVVATTTFMSLKGRVARTLLTLAEAFGRDVGSGRILIHQKLTQGDLAAMAGIARENLSRMLNEWQRAKLLSRLSGYYCIEDRAALVLEASR
jgi:CRP/FNR family transcriptional regulator, cyclic AMP receptor protein